MQPPPQLPSQSKPPANNPIPPKKPTSNTPAVIGNPIFKSPPSIDLSTLTPKHKKVPHIDLRQLAMVQDTCVRCHISDRSGSVSHRKATPREMALLDSVTKSASIYGNDQAVREQGPNSELARASEALRKYLTTTAKTN
ncbi:MAG: hypothetical protein O3C40_01405 [Planctomycetota bacterium]|nr:hypothetical protein [Planctomycetota bacterium]